jgi:hypothetical protein
VAYDVEFVELVLDYLERVEGLTDDDRAAILAGAAEELGRDADRFHALYPLAHESHCFRYDYPHPVGKTIYDCNFVVDASNREMGVMRVVYIECTPLSG